MAQRAQGMGLTQKQAGTTLVWLKEAEEHCRWLFVRDPSDIQVIREIFNNDDNVASPCCFVVVKQPDPSDERGDIIFDIFRLSPDSYLWHLNRVYTPPEKGKRL